MPPLTEGQILTILIEWLGNVRAQNPDAYLSAMPNNVPGLDALQERREAIIAKWSNEMTESYPLRPSGIYTLAGREYVVIVLGTPEDPWGALGLMGHPFRAQSSDINYVRPDGVILDFGFRPVGMARELVDTGRTLEE